MLDIVHHTAETFMYDSNCTLLLAPHDTHADGRGMSAERSGQCRQGVNCLSWLSADWPSFPSPLRAMLVVATIDALQALP